MHACTHARTHTCTHVHVHTHIHTYIWTQILWLNKLLALVLSPIISYVSLCHSHTHTHTRTCTHMHTQRHMHTHCTNTHAHTYTRRHTKEKNTRTCKSIMSDRSVAVKVDFRKSQLLSPWKPVMERSEHAWRHSDPSGILCVFLHNVHSV